MVMCAAFGNAGSCSATRPPLPANQRDADADECERRGNSVAPVMPGVGLNRQAADVLAYADHVAEQDLLGDQDAGENDKREWCWNLVQRRALRRNTRQKAIARRDVGGDHRSEWGTAVLDR